MFLLLTDHHGIGVEGYRSGSDVAALIQQTLHPIPAAIQNRIPMVFKSDRLANLNQSFPVQMLEDRFDHEHRELEPFSSALRRAIRVRINGL